MKRFIVAAVAALASSAALAASPGQWLDTRTQMALRNLPESDPELSRLSYAKAMCRPKVDMNAATDAANRGYVYAPWANCMSAQGFVWVFDTPEQVAARQQAIRAEQNRAFLSSVGQALAGVDNDVSRPRAQCPPNVLRMNC